MRLTPVDGLSAAGLGLPLPLDSRAKVAAQMKYVRRAMVRATKASAWYRTHLAQIDPQDLRVPADLARLPLMSAADLTAHKDALVCVSQAEVARIITLQTSGSTGAPKRLHFTRGDLDATLDFFWHGMRSLITDQDRVLALLPFVQPDNTGDLLIRALENGGISCQGCWPPPDWTSLAEMICAQGHTCVVGLPQHLLALAHALPQGQVRTMLLCSDYAPQVLRKRIETLCGCETFLHYGTTETGLGGAVECEVHAGCHVRECDLLVEILDPASGQPVPEGVTGEIVITTLRRQAMPLIRYRTGDMARLSTTPCACGGVTARLLGILGRQKAHILPGGGTLTSQILDDALFVVNGLLDYRATLETTVHGQGLSIEVLAWPGNLELEQTICTVLEQIPALTTALGQGLKLGPVQKISSFAPSHTIKRVISDRR